MTVNSTIEIISSDLRIHFIDIADYDKSILDAIHQNFTKICNGINGDDDIDVLKLEIRNWFIGKDNAKICGFIAEFFCHLYLNQIQFEQNFLFRNLEETKSMKKGFDGLYQLGNEVFLYESKSTLPQTIAANHNSNIGEAYRDLRDKLNGSKLDKHGNPIDPWSSAVFHASLQQVNPNNTLIQNLNIFKKSFIKGSFEDIKNFNVIPSSTIYMEANWVKIDIADLTTKMIGLVSKYVYKKMDIICINKKSVKGFIDYINS